MPTKTEKTKAPKAKVEKTKVEKTKVEKEKVEKVKAEKPKAEKVKAASIQTELPKATVKPFSPVAIPTKNTSAKIEKIKADFAALTPAEQRVLLNEWSQSVKATENPITALVELVQKTFGANLTTEIWTEGASHVPVVYCKLILPNGTEYTASGKNQKIAKLLAAEEALADVQKTE
jgi:hypothetical protein